MNETEKEPTRGELIAALCDALGFCQELYGCYVNDVQPNRYQAMNDLHSKAQRRVQPVIDRLPYDAIERAVRRYSERGEHRPTDEGEG